MTARKYINTGGNYIPFDSGLSAIKTPAKQRHNDFGVRPIARDYATTNGHIETLSAPPIVAKTADAYTPSFANPPWFHSLTSGVERVWKDIFGATANPNPTPDNLQKLTSQEQSQSRADAYNLILIAAVAFAAVKIGRKF